METTSQSPEPECYSACLIWNSLNSKELYLVFVWIKREAPVKPTRKLTRCVPAFRGRGGDWKEFYLELFVWIKRGPPVFYDKSATGPRGNSCGLPLPKTRGFCPKILKTSKAQTKPNIVNFWHLRVWRWVNSCGPRHGSRVLVRGPSGVLTPRGAMSPKFAQNWGSSLKIAWKQHDFEEILGAKGGTGNQSPLPCIHCWGQRVCPQAENCFIRGNPFCREVVKTEDLLALHEHNKANFAQMTSVSLQKVQKGYIFNILSQRQEELMCCKSSEYLWDLFSLRNHNRVGVHCLGNSWVPVDCAKSIYIWSEHLAVTAGWPFCGLDKNCVTALP